MHAAYATRSKNKHHLPKCSVSKTTWATKGTNRHNNITSSKPNADRSIILGDSTPSPNALESLKPATWPKCTTPAQPTKITTKSMGGRADADRQNNLDITSKASCGEASRKVSVANAILSAPSKASSPRAACVPVAMVVFYASTASCLFCGLLLARALVAFRTRRRRAGGDARRCKPMRPTHADAGSGIVGCCCRGNSAIDESTRCVDG